MNSENYEQVNWIYPQNTATYHIYNCITTNTTFNK